MRMITGLALIKEEHMAQGKNFIDIDTKDYGIYPNKSVRVYAITVAKYFSKYLGSTRSDRIFASVEAPSRVTDRMAQFCLNYFKSTNVEGMRKAARSFGLKPKF